VKASTPRIQDGWAKRRARICSKEIPRKVYQRKKALMRRPGTVLTRLRRRGWVIETCGLMSEDGVGVKQKET
jgi:hypothetical protein